MLGTLGFLTAEFIPILGGEAILIGLGIQTKLSWNTLVWLLLAFAVLRAIFRFSEQRTNHYIAFTLLAIIRDRVFKALRRLCPAKLEGRDIMLKGRYGDMQAFAKKLKDLGYEEVKLIDTTNGMFMSRFEAYGWNFRDQQYW